MVCGRPHGAARTGRIFFVSFFMMFRGGHTGPPFGWAATWGRPYGLYGSRRVSYRGVLGGHMGPPIRVAWYTAGVVPWRVGRPHGAAPTVRIFFVLFFMMFATITHGAAIRVGRPHGAARTGCMVHGGCRTVACWAATWGRPYGLYYLMIR